MARPGAAERAGAFSGRSALDLFGRCMGLGDSFDVSIRPRPTSRTAPFASRRW
jgi:hypothetical protein